MKLSPEDFEKIKSFLSSDKRCMFVTGSAMYNKHKLVMAALDTLLRDSTILFRTNALLNIPVSGFLDWVGVSKIPASGQKYRIYNNYYQFDSMGNSGPRSRTANYVDCAIVYPAESAILYDKFAPIEELFSRKRVGKVFIIVNKNMSLCECGNLQKYVDCTLELNDTRARC